MEVYSPGNSACCPLLKYVEFIHEMNAMTSLNVEKFDQITKMLNKVLEPMF